MRVLFILICAIFFYTNLNAQEQIQFSQIHRVQALINPAYASSRDDINAMVLYRNQWVGMSGTPVIQAFAFRYPSPRKRFALGLTIKNNNWAFYNKSDVMVSYGYHVFFNDSSSRLSFGIQGGINFYTIRWNQIVVGKNNPDVVLENNFKPYSPNIGYGVFYNTKNFFSGFSVPEVFYKNSEGNEIAGSKFRFRNHHFYWYSGYVQDLGDYFKFKPTLLVKKVWGAPIQADIMANLMFRNALGIGVGYRSGDAFILMCEFNIRNLSLSYSFDYTLTELSTISSNTHEIGLSYSFVKSYRNISIRYF